MKNEELSSETPIPSFLSNYLGLQGVRLDSDFPWIGDIALSYAINRTFGLKELKFGYTRYGPKI